jgi:hypothetical protein
MKEPDPYRGLLYIALVCFLTVLLILLVAPDALGAAPAMWR